MVKDTWDRLVWHYLAQDGSKKPNHAQAAAAAGVSQRAARQAWAKGSGGLPAIEQLRKRVLEGKSPFPAQPAGAPDPKGGLYYHLRRKGKVAANASATSTTTTPKAPPSDPDDEVDWGGGPMTPEDVAALGSVSYPDDLSPRPTRVHAGTDHLDPATQAQVEAAEARVFNEAMAPPASSIVAGGDAVPPLPSDYTHLPPLDRELGERLLQEMRTDLLELSARGKRTTSMVTHMAQTLALGMVGLAQRLQADMIKLANQADPVDVEHALRLMERAFKVCRAASAMTTSTFVAERHAIAELSLHLRSVDPKGTGPTGTRSNEDLLAELRHTQERLAKTEARLQRRTEENGQAPPTPQAAEEAGVAPEPPPPPVDPVPTRSAMEAQTEPGAWIGGQQYAREGRVQPIARGAKSVEADVEGSTPEPYRARFWVTDEGEKAHACTCPQGVHRPTVACKHLVALALVWWSTTESEAPAAGTTAPPVDASPPGVGAGPVLGSPVSDGAGADPLVADSELDDDGADEE